MSWFGISTNETIKDKGKSKKYQHFISISFHQFLRAGAVTIIHFAVSLNH